MTINKKLWLILLLTGLLTGCENTWYPFLYHPTLEQGNIPNPSTVVRLKTGMTKTQVLTIMGDPILETPVTSDTWDYVYMLRQDGKLTQHHNLKLYFNNNVLQEIRK